MEITIQDLDGDEITVTVEMQEIVGITASSFNGRIGRVELDRVELALNIDQARQLIDALTLAIKEATP